MTETVFYCLSSLQRKSELVNTVWRCHMGSFVSLWQISVSNMHLCITSCIQSTKWQQTEPPSTSGRQQITFSTYRWQNGTHLQSLYLISENVVKNVVALSQCFLSVVNKRRLGGKGDEYDLDQALRPPFSLGQLPTSGKHVFSAKNTDADILLIW